MGPLTDWPDAHPRSFTIDADAFDYLDLDRHHEAPLALRDDILLHELILGQLAKDRTELGPQDVTGLQTGGGGGWGNPFERDPVRVREDVLEGYVSLTSAKKEYGVVLRAGDLSIDEKATKTARSAANKKPAKRAAPAKAVKGKARS